MSTAPRRTNHLPTEGGAMPRVSGFLPSRSAFHFANSFPNIPLRYIDIGPARVPIGNAANGICGGMAVATRPTSSSPVSPHHPIRLHRRAAHFTTSSSLASSTASTCLAARSDTYTSCTPRCQTTKRTSASWGLPAPVVPGRWSMRNGRRSRPTSTQASCHPQPRPDQVRQRIRPGQEPPGTCVWL